MSGLVALTAPEYTPSPLLRAEAKRAHRLVRNLERASTFNPRLIRRALIARDRVEALHAHERTTFEEAHRG